MAAQSTLDREHLPHLHSLLLPSRDGVPHDERRPLAVASAIGHSRGRGGAKASPALAPDPLTASPPNMAPSPSCVRHLPTLPFHCFLPPHLPALRSTWPLPLASSGGGINFGGGGGDDDLPSGGGGEGDKNKAEGGDDDASVSRKEALFLLAQLGQKLKSLPVGMAAAVDGGRLPGEIVCRFADLEKSHVFRWLLQFGGFRERLLADDLFFAKVVMECGVGIFTKRPHGKRTVDVYSQYR